MHFILLYFLALHSMPDTSVKPIHWENTRNWKIYTLNKSSTVFKLPADSLHNLNGAALGDDSMHIFLSTAKLLHVPMSPAWMGCYLTSCENEKGQLMKIVVSVYGGFFLNYFDGNYYQLDPALTRIWLAYMNRSYKNTD